LTSVSLNRMRASAQSTMPYLSTHAPIASMAEYQVSYSLLVSETQHGEQSIFTHPEFVNNNYG